MAKILGTAESRVPARLIFLIVAGLVFILVSLIVAWWGGVWLVNQYAQTKIAQVIRSLNVEKNVRYKDASYNVFTGVTVLHDVEIKLSESASPVKVAELRIDQFREENGTPMEVNFTAEDFFEDLIDVAVQLEYDEVNVDNWKSIAQGSGLSVGVNPQILEQLMAHARFVSLDCELVDLGLTDRITDWGSRITGSTKEQFRITAQQQLKSRMPDDLAAYRASLAQIFQQRSRVQLSMHPDQPIGFSDPVFTDPHGLQQRLGIKLEVTPMGK